MHWAHTGRAPCVQLLLARIAQQSGQLENSDLQRFEMISKNSRDLRMPWSAVQVSVEIVPVWADTLQVTTGARQRSASLRQVFERNCRAIEG